MKKALILLTCFFRLTPLISQHHKNPVDSIISGISLSGKDWVIGLTIDVAGRIPIYDSLGNALDEDPNGFYIISHINNQCVLRRYDYDYTETIPGANLKLVKQINLPGSDICTYTIDSIQKTANEWIYPNTYSENQDSLKIYAVQQNGDHSPFYSIYFRTKQTNFHINFGEIDIFNYKQPHPFLRENLNFKYNSSTFIYRAFINFIMLLKGFFKFQILV